MANEQNLIPLTREAAAKGRENRNPESARARKAIGKMQAALLKCFDALVEEEGKEGPILRDMKPSELAACATAWDRLEDRRGVLKGHGKPKPVQATNDPGRQEPAKVVAAAAEEMPDMPAPKFG